MTKTLIKAYGIGFLVFFIGIIISVNLGEFLDAGSIENARAYIITFAILFLASVVTVTHLLLINELRNKTDK